MDGKYNFHRGFIFGYDEQREKYKFMYKTSVGTIKKMLVPRIYACLDLESPERHCERISKAFVARIYADNLIKLQFYVNNMPTEGLSQIDFTQK